MQLNLVCGTYGRSYTPERHLVIQFIVRRQKATAPTNMLKDHALQK